MKTNPIRYSSAVGEIWTMATFKVKYCHKIFDILAVRMLCETLLIEAFNFNGIRWKKIAFDSDHVHIILDIGIFAKHEIAKKVRGYVAKGLFSFIPWLKPKYFWGSGLWNPAYDIRGISDLGFYERYLDKQKYSNKGQKTLSSF